MVARRIEVEYAAAPRKLPRPLYLLGQSVAAADESALRLLRRAGLAVLDSKGSFDKHIGRKRPLRKRRNRRDRDGRLPLCQRVQRGNAPLLCLSRHGLRVIEHEVAHRERRNVHFQHGAQVVCHVLRRRVIRRDNKHGSVRFVFQRRRQICAVYRRKPGNERRKPTALHKGGECGGFLVIQYLIKKNVHIYLCACAYSGFLMSSMNFADMLS